MPSDYQGPRESLQYNGIEIGKGNAIALELRSNYDSAGRVVVSQTLPIEVKGGSFSMSLCRLRTLRSCLL